MHLYLMQHGEAVASGQDPARPLSEAGRADVERLAALLAERGIALSRVVHSGKLRARQTAEIIAARLAPSVEPEAHDGLAPKDRASDFASGLAAWDADSLIVGHLPSMDRCLSWLVAGHEGGGTAAFRPGAMVCLAPDESGGWSIVWMLQPDLL